MNCNSRLDSLGSFSLLLFILLACQTTRECSAEDNTAARIPQQLSANAGKPEGDKQSVKRGTLSVRQLERYMFELINRDRAKFGVAAVRLDPQLCKLARHYANYMMTKGFFSHEDPDGRGEQQRAGHVGITCGIYENIGQRSGPGSNAEKLESVEESFLAEPDVTSDPPNDRWILLTDYDLSVGVGIAVRKDKLIVVQEFGGVSVVELDPKSR